MRKMQYTTLYAAGKLVAKLSERQSVYVYGFSSEVMRAHQKQCNIRHKSGQCVGQHYERNREPPTVHYSLTAKED